jgi:hypothetical protein
MKRLSLIAVLGCTTLLLPPPPSAAQDETNLQLWADYHAHYYQSSQREWYADAGARVLPEDFSWAQVYARPSLRFHRRRSFDGHAGVGVSYTYNEDLANALELRPWQGIKFRWPVLNGLSFSHYFRFEQRFSFTDGESELALRFRYKLSTRIALKRASAGRLLDPFFLPVSVEVFADAGPKIEPLFGSRGRFDIGLGYTMGDEWVGEFHFIVQASRSGLDAQLDTSEYILRFQVKHLIASRDYRLRQTDLPE